MNNCVLVVIGLVAAQYICGCARPVEKREVKMDAAIGLSLEFLSRQGCVNTPVMHRNLDAALSEIAITSGYKNVDVGALPASDYRRGYGTPTVLVNGNDLFGMERHVPSAEPG